MSRNVKRVTRDSINSLLNVVDVELVKKKKYFSDYRDYIPLQETVEAARQANMSVGDYIDFQHNEPGATQKTIDKLKELGVFDTNIDKVCEIGPGSGRYLEKIFQICGPDCYEIYETSDEWAKWLVSNYPIVEQPTDGSSLLGTPSDSMDLVHTHKVLPGQPSLVICRYYLEMIRVVRKGGKIVFDIVTEQCMEDDMLDSWLRAGAGYQHYPCLVPRQFTIDFFGSRGFSFDGDFLVRMKPGWTNYFAFTNIDSK